MLCCMISCRLGACLLLRHVLYNTTFIHVCYRAHICVLCVYQLLWWPASTASTCLAGMLTFVYIAHSVAVFATEMYSVEPIGYTAIRQRGKCPFFKHKAQSSTKAGLSFQPSLAMKA